MTTFRFKVEIAKEDAIRLNKEGFQLAVNKSTDQSPTSSNSIPVQWLSIPVDATAFTITWTEQYQVFFTRSLIQEGAFIDESSGEPCTLGQAYGYKGVEFTSQAGKGVGAGDIQIYNNLLTEENFGVSQAFTNAKGQVIFSPIAVTSVFPGGGNVIFTPKNTVTVYFNQAVGNGILTSSSTSPITLNMKPGTVPTIRFENGLWSKPALLSAEDAAPTPYTTNMWDFLIVFSGSIITAVAVGWFTREINRGGKNWTFSSESPNGRSIKLNVTAPTGQNPTAALEDLVGEEIPAINRTRREKGTYTLSGTAVVVNEIRPWDSPTSAIWNALNDILSARGGRAPRDNTYAYALTPGSNRSDNSQALTPTSGRKGDDVAEKRKQLAILNRELASYENFGDGVNGSHKEDKQSQLFQ